MTRWIPCCWLMIMEELLTTDPMTFRRNFSGFSVSQYALFVQSRGQAPEKGFDPVVELPCTRPPKQRRPR